MVSNKEYGALIDTGALVSLINETLFHSGKLKRTQRRVKDANGNTIPLVGSVSIKLITPQGDSLEEFLVVSKSANISHNIVLGMNLMGSAHINFQNKTMRFKGSQNS